MKNQITGNAGLYWVSWQLSRRGWNVMPTVRNARGADLYAVDQTETRIIAVQSKALSRRASVPLGLNLENLRSKWWIISVGANSDAPVCYVLTLEEVKGRATRNEGKHRAYWLEPKNYELDEFREAWHRLEAT